MATSQTDQFSASFLQMVLDAIPEVTVVIDRDYRLAFANRAARQLAADRNLALDDLKCHALFHGSAFPCHELGLECPLKNVIQTRKATMIQRVLLDAEGNETHMEIHVSPVFDDEGHVQRVIEVWHDVTDRNRVQQALRASEETYRVLFQQTADATLIIDEDRFVDCNDAAVAMMRFDSRSQLLRVRPVDLSPEVQPDGRSSEEKAAEILARAFREGSQRFEWRHRRADGTLFPVEVLLTAVPVAGKQILHCVWRDITDRKQAEQEREELIASLEAQNAELERFAYSASHDLKSPLVTVKGFLGLLRADLASGDHEAVENDLERIENAASKMSVLLNDLLELSRIGRVTNDPEPVPFEELTREAVELVRGQFTAAGARIEIQEGLPIVYGDCQRLLEVVQNLIDNAIKYMGSQPSPVVEIGCRTSSDPPVFYVKDNGIGIDPAFQDRVFGLFTQLDQTAEGSGVGLALVKRIVELHEGRVWVESQGAGQGATFCFTLPLAAP